MTEPSHLTRTLQQFADTLRGLRPENLSKESAPPYALSSSN